MSKVQSCVKQVRHNPRFGVFDKMGSVIGKAMDENMKKQQDFMLKTQQLQLERMIQMNNQMRERMMAAQISRARDMFHFFAVFYGFACIGGIAGFMKMKKPGAIAPLLPLTFVFMYQGDMAYGDKMVRIREEADRIMDKEAHLLDLPHGLPTFSSIEAARLKQMDENRVNQGHDIFL
ncbi:LOW QUALITY PROTEIN: plasminogen receptor (KT)-like [Pecten maximus]|uniref:LOW QUALITY PROTEIN: plasminogen receptor (KT)-like n=1 Tax=Pecten maximus TaxID=6579 RepID=UPI001458ECF1|nr:LOW QUALITY PROTEIN: plasminogen receptor (KT)-like [Pecten maximus]